MHVEFHGAARTVTGSCTLLEAGGTRLLVDCGQFQGDEEQERRNRGERLGFDPASLHAVVLTHSHIDHIGRAPILTQRGFRGHVFCTRATAELVHVMLLDAAKIQEEDARHGGPPAIYGEREVEAFCAALRPVYYREPVSVSPSLAFALSDAGHILGSAHVLATMKEGGRTAVFGVSGDVGSKGRPAVGDPTPFPAADYVQIESTYGDRDHRSPQASVEELERLLVEADQGNGVLVIPAFALGRTQDILYLVNQWKERGRLKNLAVYVDSPLATRITAVFRGNEGIYDDDAKGLLRRGDDPFDFDGLRYVGSHEESQRLSQQATRAAIIASSGMCQSGRVLGHLEHLLPRPSTKVAIVGFQAPGTLGRRLVDGAKMVHIRGHAVPVNATIHTLGGFSAHGGRTEMLDWLAVTAKARPIKKVFLCHGEPRTLDSFAAAIRDRLHVETHIPHLHERVEL